MMAKENDVKQFTGFRIWNTDKSAILLYLLKKSTTWTIPIVQDNNITSCIQLLLDQFVDAELGSAVCILNTKKIIPTQDTNIIFRYVIYDTIIKYKNLKSEHLPSNTRAINFMPVEHVYDLTYKTPILACLIKYMKEKEKHICGLDY